MNKNHSRRLVLGTDCVPRAAGQWPAARVASLWVNLRIAYYQLRCILKGFGNYKEHSQ